MLASEERAGAQGAKVRVGGLVSAVDEGSPAQRAGLAPGCRVLAVDGQAVHDVIDWRWLTADDEAEVSFADAGGKAHEALMERGPGEGWGVAFDDVVFDGVRQCRNACTFCFMRQLPKGSRESLRLRDDDFRLSFLEGTYVTFTNMSDADVARVEEQRISPLRFSLHAVTPEVRRRVIGRHAARGLQVADELLDAGIQLHVQVVLMPGVNDGDELARTLSWCWKRPGVLSVGIVPVGYTDFQDRFEKSFDDPVSSRAVIELVAPYQRRAREERGSTWVYAADEFYCNAYGDQVADRIPPAADYDGFPLFEDGIGMVRSTVDEWRQAEAEQRSCARALEGARTRVLLVCGRALEPVMPALLARSALSGRVVPLFVDNRHFGGNVDVTGLLCADDVVPAAKDAVARERARDGGRVLVALPQAMFNAAGQTLDGSSAEEMVRQLGGEACVVPLTAREAFLAIESRVRGRR